MNINATRGYTHYKESDTFLFVTALEGLAKIHITHSDWMHKFRVCTQRISHWTCDIFIPAWEHSGNKIMRNTFLSRSSGKCTSFYYLYSLVLMFILVLYINVFYALISCVTHIIIS